MKMTHIRGEILLAAADRSVLNRDLREGVMHLKVDETFYGSAAVSDETFLSSLSMCTIANLVGKHSISLAVKNEFIDGNNVITIQGIPHAQYAKMIE